MIKGFEGVLDYIEHDYDNLIFIPSADYVVVEGTSEGKMSGKSWVGGKTPGDVSVTCLNFETNELSVCIFILNPDYTGDDKARFRWGENRHW